MLNTFLLNKNIINLIFFQKPTFCSESCHLPKYNSLMTAIPWITTAHYCQGYTLAFSKCNADSPIRSIVDHFSKGIIALPFVWDVEWLKNVRKRCVIPTYS